MGYLALKYLHVFLAILSVGFKIAAGMIAGRARRAGTTELTFTLKTIKALDDVIGNPGYVVLLVTGILMAKWTGQMGSGWVHASMGLLVIVIGLSYGLYAPALRAQITALEARGPQDPEFLRHAAQSQLLGALTGLLVLSILYLMVFKPF